MTKERTSTAARGGRARSGSPRRPITMPRATCGRDVGSARRPRRVAVVTGSRAEYGLLRTTLVAIEGHPRLTLQLVVTGMHLLKQFGLTVQQVEQDGWRIDARVPMQYGDDGPMDQAQGLARGLAGMAAFFDRARTDLVVVLGDRIEAMAGALAATTTGRQLVHIHGGDVAPGDLDGKLRDAMTKLADVHMAATRKSANRIIKMGEAAERVIVVGAPGLDELLAIANNGRPERDPARALVVFHAYGRSAGVERTTMRSILRAVASQGLSATVIHPNTDRGNSGVLAAIDEVRRETSSPIMVVHSLGRTDYLHALLSAGVLVGNSSSGIIEAGSVGVPCVNVGVRQEGRLPGGSTVVHAGEDYGAIREAIGKALRLRPDKKRGKSPYGDGHTGARIASILAELPLTSKSMTKPARHR